MKKRNQILVSLLRAAVAGALTTGVRQALLRSGFKCAAKYALRGAVLGAAGGAVTLAFSGWTIAAMAGSVVRTIAERKMPQITC